MTLMLPLWAEIVISVLLLACAGASLLAAIGVARMSTFFERLHATALVPTLAVWSVALASILYFSLGQGTLELHALALVAILALTAPLGAVLLARAALFRQRQAGEPGVPRPLPAPGVATHEQDAAESSAFDAAARRAAAPAPTPAQPGLPD